MRRINSGDIFKIQLKDRSFSYFKYINVLKVNGNASYPHLIKVYDFFTKEEEIDINTEFMNSKRWFMNPLVITDIKRLSSEPNVSFLTNLPIDNEDIKLPKMKRESPLFIGGYDEKLFEEIQIIEDLDSSKFSIQKPINTGNIEWSGALNFDKVAFRILLEKHKKNINKFLKFYPKFDWLEQEVYDRAININFIR